MFSAIIQRVLIWAMIFMLCLQSLLNAQTLDIHHLDVGQGDATFIVIKAPDGSVHKTVLIDGGLKRYGQSIINYITGTLGIHRIDFVVASHYDKDHVGGLAVVLEYGFNNPGMLTIDSILDRGQVIANHPDKGRPYKIQAARFGLRRRTLVPGNILKLFDDFAIGTGTGRYNIGMFCVCVNGRIFSKAGNINAVSRLPDPDENDLSTGFLLWYGKFEYLTCGDIGGKAGGQPPTCDGPYGCKFANIETDFIGATGQVSAYKLNHHGSRCSSNANWVTTAASPVAFISSGKNGHYKHPREEVVRALNNNAQMVNYYMTSPINYYHRTITAGKGILNPVANNPVNLTVNRVNNGIDITVASVFMVQGIWYRKN